MNGLTMRFNKFLILEQSFLLIDYASSAMNTLYSSRKRLIVYQKPGLLFKNIWNFLGTPTQAGVIIFLLNFAYIFYLPMPTKVCTDIFF